MCDVIDGNHTITKETRILSINMITTSIELPIRSISNQYVHNIWEYKTFLICKTDTTSLS
jgi:hypothetical protein